MPVSFSPSTWLVLSINTTRHPGREDSKDYQSASSLGAKRYQRRALAQPSWGPPSTVYQRLLEYFWTWHFCTCAAIGWSPTDNVLDAAKILRGWLRFFTKSDELFLKRDITLQIRFFSMKNSHYIGNWQTFVYFDSFKWCMSCRWAGYDPCPPTLSLKLP